MAFALELLNQSRDIALLFSFLFFSSLLFSLPSYAATSTDSLVGYWKFDETSGTSATDFAGDGNTGTHTGGPTISTDVPSMISFTNTRSLSFDGVDDYVRITNSASLNTTNALTYSYWVKPNSFPGSIIINNHIQNAGSPISGVVTSIGTDGKPDFQLRVGNACCQTIDGVTALSANQWYLITNTWDGSTMRLYVNGVLDSSLAAAGTLQINRDTFIGINADEISRPTPVLANMFPGLIDDIRIYNRALSATEISALAAGNHPLATWDGDTSTNFETAANWDIGAIPDPYNRVTIANAGARPVCTANIQTTGLTINSGASLDLSSYNLTQNDSGTFVNNGTLLLNGTQTLTSFTNDTDTGTEIIRGSTNLTGFPTGTTYNNLRIEDPTENGLVGYWKLDEGGGTSAADLSGNSNTGTLTNGPTYSTTVNSTTTYPNPYSLSFDGVNDYVDLGSGTIVNTSQAFSISFWVEHTTANDYATILRLKGSSNEFGFNVGRSGNSSIGGTSIHFGFRNNPSIVSSNSSYFTGNILNQWHHYIVIYNGGAVGNASSYSVYVDGTSVSLTASGNIGGTSNTNVIGQDGGGGGSVAGLIDDVRIYNRALSATEIANLAAGRYAAGDTGTATHTFNGNVTVNGTLSLDSGIISSSSYTDTVTGLASIYGGAYTAGTATQTFNGGLTVAGGTYTGGTGTSDVNGTLTISAGTLVAPGSTSSLNVSGNFAHSGGTFTHNSGTVILDGNDQTISGATTFNHLTKSTSNTTLTFPASTTSTIAGTLTLQGAMGLPIRLRSSTDGTQWRIDPQGTRTVEYLDIKDSNNINATAISASTLGTFTNSGNNTNWTFNQTPNAPRVSSAMLNNDSLSNDLTTFNTEHGELLVINFTATDSDGSDTITLSTVTTPSIGRFEAMSGNPASATFTYSPSYFDSGMAYTFSVRASDGTANSASDLSITVHAPKGYPYAPPAIQAPSTTEVKSENKPTVVVVIPPTKPTDETAGGRPGDSGEPAMGRPGEPAIEPTMDEPPKPEISIPFIEAAFPEVPSFEQLPGEKPKKDKPTQTNVILAGSENTFALPGNSDAAKELRNQPGPLSEVEVLVTITDSAGNSQIVPATVLVAAGKNDNSPVVINTEQISQNLAEGQAIIELSINGVPKAQINVVISKSQLRSEDEILADLNKPFILSVKAIRKGEFLKVLITGSNFFDKELIVGGKPVETTEKQTEISMLPNNGMERVQMNIKSKNLIVATYMIKDKKKISRNLVLTVTNPYGRAVSTFEVPKK